MLSTVRTPLKEISGNRPNGKHLSPYWRGVIAGEARTGGTPTEIAKDLKLDRETIRHTISLDQLRDEGKSLPREPRGKSYTPLDERHILHWYADTLNLHTKRSSTLATSVVRRLPSRRSSKRMVLPIGSASTAHYSQPFTRRKGLLGASNGGV